MSDHMIPDYNNTTQSTPSSVSFSLGLWNATGLNKTSIHDLLRHCTSHSLIFITETWLLPPTRLHSSWKEFHLYGTPVAGEWRGSQGVSALVAPSCPLPVMQIPIHNKYALGLQLGRSLRVICLYLPPTLDSSTICDVLATLPLTHDTILCGDFNARMGDITGDHDTNTRGTLLKEWCEEHDFTILNSSLAHGQPTFLTWRNGREMSSIVDYFLSNITLQHSSINIRSDLSLGSDHKLMTLSFTYTIPPTTITDSSSSSSPRRLWNLSRLMEDDVRELYQSTFATCTADLTTQLHDIHSSSPPTRPPIDDINDQLNTAIYTALDRSVGSRQTRPKHWKKFWTKDLQDLADARERCYKRWRRAIGLDKVTWWIRHQEAQDRFQKALRKAKRESWKVFCRHLEQGDSSQVLHRISKITARRKQQVWYTHPDGPAAGAQAMRDHLAAIYSGTTLPSTRPHPLDHQSHPTPYDLQSVEAGDSALLFPSDHIKDLICKLPRKKAPGADHLRAEMLLPIRDTLAPILSMLFELCCQWSYTPSLWRTAQVVPIYKKGDPSSAANYRPISLTSIMRKLFEINLAPIVSRFSPPLDIAQGGFRPSRSALDQALCLHDMMKEYSRRHRHRPIVAFLDIKSAYDTVDRQIIWQSLLSVAAPFALVSLLANMFDDVSITVLLANHVSSPFHPITGVLQGSVLSPHLYSVYINTLPALLRSASQLSTITVPSLSPSAPPSPTDITRHGLPYGPILDTTTTPTDTAINCLLYADDVALVGSCLEVNRMLALAQQHSYTLGYRWSPSKCAVLNAPTPRQANYHPLQLYDQDLPTVDEFVYLGVPFDRTGISTSAIIQHRKPGTILSMSQLSAIGANRSGFSLLLSARLYATFVRPKIEYGLAIAKLLQKDYNALEKVQDTCLRMIMGAHKTASTMVLKHVCNLPSMRFRADTLKLRYCIRYDWLPEDCLIHQLSTTLPFASLQTIRSHRMIQDYPFDADPPIRTTTWLRTYRQQLFDTFIANTDQKLIRACRPSLHIDPILTVPASRHDRSRLLRWRIGWLPGKPRPCPCKDGDLSRNHVLTCKEIPANLWRNLPTCHDPSPIHRLDYTLNQLPLSSNASCPSWWRSLCTILRHIDMLTHPDGDFAEEPFPGDLWASSIIQHHFSPDELEF